MKKSLYESENWYHLLPDENKRIEKKFFRLFFETMIERQKIWYKRFVLKEDAPWTENKFFKYNKFTNVYRDLDRNSQFLINNVILKEKDKKELIWKILLFRIFNNPELFTWISSQKKSFKGCFPSYYRYDRKELAELIIKYDKLGNNPFTTAYIVAPICVGMPRTEQYAKNVILDLYSSVDELCGLMEYSDNPEQIIDRLKQCRGVADFIAHEFYQDFTYPELYTGEPLMKFDQDDFTNVGNGAKLGIRLIFPNLVSKNQKKAIYWLRNYGNYHLDVLGFLFISWNKKNKKYDVKKEGKITLHQIEMWLCEFGKYWKMEVKVGKQRSKFVPRTIIKDM